MKKIILAIFLGLALIMPNMYMQAGHPSVNDVFGGLSEQQIADQVKEGQKFLEELEKNGSPEEKAEFERLLMETLDSMSEQDFNDITNIAKMVEPHLELPAEQPKPIEPIVAPKTETKPERPIVEGSDVEMFQNLIGAITESIDQLMQKMQSSKDCSEEVDIKWKSKTTFNNMKRQIYQLKTKRLAQKLSKRELSAEEEELVKQLKQFSKDLSAQNNDFKIEDNFGLPTNNIELDKKHLKQTQAILSMFNNYIDALMPMLEKFLRKWEPEALEMSKEAEEKSKSALQDSMDAAKITPQKAATPEQRATRAQGGSAYGQSAAGYPGGYGLDGYGGGPGGYGPGGYDGGGDENKRSGTGKKEDDKATAQKAKEEKAKDASEKEKLSPYDYVANELAEHTKDLFATDHEENFVGFLHDIVTQYPPASQTVTVPPTTPITNELGQTNWIENDFKNYTTKVKHVFRSNFLPEFKHLGEVITNVKKKFVDMSSDDLQKLQSNQDLVALERRFARYKAEFDPIEESINAKKLQNTTSQQSTTSTANNGIFIEKGPQYTKAHNDFLTYLGDNVGDQISTFAMDLENLKRKAKRSEGSMRSAAKKQAKTGSPAPTAIPAAA